MTSWKTKKQKAKGQNTKQNSIASLLPGYKNWKGIKSELKIHDVKYKYYKYYRAGYLRLFISWCGWSIIKCQNAGVHFRENCRKGLLWHRTWHAHRTNGIFVKQQFGEKMFSIPFLQQWEGRKPTPVKLDSDWIHATIDMLFNIHTTHTFDK